MLLDNVIIENFRAVGYLPVALDERLTVLHGENGEGKSSVLRAIAVGLGMIPQFFGVKGINFHDDDRREVNGKPVDFTSIYLEVKDTGIFQRNTSWGKRLRTSKKDKSLLEAAPANRAVLRDVRFPFARIVEEIEAGKPTELPVLAFYGTDRVVIGLDRSGLPQRRRNFKTEFTRQGALDGALEGKTNFKAAFEWFYAAENDELREQKERGAHFRLTKLEAVRRAIESMIPGVSEPHVTIRPLHFAVRYRRSDQDEELYLEQLSGGYRVMLALVVDLARRMGQANPHLENPLESQAIVLIDEVELHLHPSWQQRVLPDLLRTFPNAQFIVSTHSPQVLTTIRPKHIYLVRNGREGVQLHSTPGPTLGAEAGFVLDTEMGVQQRPNSGAGEASEFVRTLDEYMRLIDNDEGESAAALALRATLKDLSPDDPSLDKADIEIRRRLVLRKLGRDKK